MLRLHLRSAFGFALAQPSVLLLLFFVSLSPLSRLSDLLTLGGHNHPAPGNEKLVGEPTTELDELLDSDVAPVTIVRGSEDPVTISKGSGPSVSPSAESELYSLSAWWW